MVFWGAESIATVLEMIGVYCHVIWVQTESIACKNHIFFTFWQLTFQWLMIRATNKLIADSENKACEFDPASELKTYLDILLVTITT